MRKRLTETRDRCAARLDGTRTAARTGLAPALFVATAGFAAVLFGLLATTDLRGWPPSSAGPAGAMLKATPEGSGDFRMTDCLPGTVEPHAVPRGGEAAGSATLSVTACRSTSSVLIASVLYWAAAVGALSILRRPALTRLRRRRHP